MAVADLAVADADNAPPPISAHFPPRWTLPPQIAKETRLRGPEVIPCDVGKWPVTSGIWKSRGWRVAIFIRRDWSRAISYDRLSSEPTRSVAHGIMSSFCRVTPGTD